MKKYLLPVLAALILIPIGIIITMQILKGNQQNLWDPSGLATRPKTERSGERRTFTHFKTYVSKDLKFSMKIPEDWTVEKEEGSLYFLSNPKDEKDQIRENINVLREDLSGDPKTLEEYTEIALAQIKTMEGYAIIGSQDIQIDGNPAKTVVYRALVKNVSLTFQQAWTVTDDAAYVLTLATQEETFPEYAQLFVRMANTLSLQ